MSFVTNAVGGVSWLWVLKAGGMLGCFNVLVDRLLKRPRARWMELSISGLVFFGVILWPGKGFKDVMLALCLGWLLDSAVGMVWKKPGTEAAAGNEKLGS